MIPQNDWQPLADAVADVASGSFVSVVVPAHCDQEMLELCVAALTAQTLSRDKFEVVVVDHKSKPPLHRPNGLPSDFNMSVHRLDSGSGPGASRAFGAEQATGDVLVFMDVDILASPDMIRQYALLPSHDASVVSLGFREFLDPDGVSREEVTDVLANHGLMQFVAARPAAEGQEWINDFLGRAGEGLLWRDDLWVIVVGAGIGVSRKLYDLAGGFRDFPVHGVEDIEFGWRVFQAGAVIAPNRAAIGVHWGLRSISVGRAEIMRLREGYLANLIAHNRHRVPGANRVWDVPKILVQVVCKPGTTATALVRTCHDLLLSAESDLVIEVLAHDTLEDADLAHSWLDSEPRVAFSDSRAGEVPESVPFLLRVFAGVRFTANAVDGLVKIVTSDRVGVVCVVAASDEISAELWRTSVLARATFFAADDTDLRTAARAVAGEEWLPGDRVGVGYDVGASDASKVGGRWVLEKR